MIVFGEIAKEEPVSAKKIREATSIAQRTLARIIGELTDTFDLIEHIGSNKTGGYVLTEKGKILVSQIEQILVSGKNN